MVITIHPPLPAAITFAPELRLTHRLRLHEACSILFDSIPTRRVDGVLGYSMVRRTSRVSTELDVQNWLRSKRFERFNFAILQNCSRAPENRFYLQRSRFSEPFSKKNRISRAKN
ncbi:hypothetical protein PIB30_061558 [Stylosanthes scabra]|uniref:Uncharacterized protein n=1 Tax=Stylosanthes scabra TaxID=79078 RepID=A0ABU6UJN4_9FABA|nr:hypothetical protein [Stylosanthes scabra]